jgi:hypothetical protein
MWKQQKTDEIKNLIINCAGIFAEATTREEFVLKGDTATVTCSINKRNNVDVKLRWVGNGKRQWKTTGRKSEHQPELFIRYQKLTIRKSAYRFFNTTLLVAAAADRRQFYDHQSIAGWTGVE